MATQLTVSAPGRICLFGEHQDYLGLPVITAAINLRIKIQGGLSRDDKVRIDCPDVGEYDAFSLFYPLRYSKERDYFKSTLNVLQRAGLDLKGGVDVVVRGTIPINSGTSSSSALVVAWSAFLLKMAGDERAVDPLKIAALAHAAEVLEFKEPGGMMDHYSSALGGVQFISFENGTQPEALPVQLGAFVLGDSREPKDTRGILARVKNGAQHGLRIMGRTIHVLSEDEIDAFRGQLSADQEKILRAQIIDRHITQVAVALMQTAPFDHAQFGHLLSKHQEQLRDGLGISTHKIDRMIDAAMAAGALGAKINGSGGGGCMFAYAPQYAERVAEAIARAGGKAYVIKVDEGVKMVENSM
ncbi:GHMP kinase [candidate division KSB1 bacterium]|nr:GHMP kinase [candidate division KSB1 bacterium]